MNGIEPIINLLVVLTALSIAAERITNIWKLRTAAFSVAKPEASAEKERESAIAKRSMLVGILLAIALKADLIAMLRQLEAPWDTLGWWQIHGSIVAMAPAARSVSGALVGLLGCVATGAALGFGSKFWHDLLDTFLELRNMARNKNVATTRKKGVSAKSSPMPSEPPSVLEVK